MNLRDYEQNKFAIAELLRAIARLIPEKQTDWRQRLNDLFVRLAEDRFNLVLAGRFSRGKTSLMNALLGTDRLPTGIAPLTSVITAVTYGSKELVVLKYNNRMLDKEISIEALPQHITQQGNPGNVQQIRLAEIQLPIETLRRGFYFIDTPGLGSVITENTLTTEAFLPEADAFILVTSYESPLSEEEMRFFKAGSSSGRRIFVVLNKHDTVPFDDRRSAFTFVQQQIQQVFGREAPHLFSVSCTEGLAAKRAGDRSRLQASGMAELETQLLHFVLKAKRGAFLVRMCDRGRAFLEELPRSQQAAELIQQFHTLASQLGRGGDVGMPFTSTKELPNTVANLHALAPCEICTKIHDAVWSFLCTYQYALSTKPEEQTHFSARGGFCPFHTWQYEAVASPYGICNAYPRVLDRLAAELREAGSAANPNATLVAKVRDLLPTQCDCAICAVRDRTEHQTVLAVAGRVEGEREVKALSAVCLPHLALLVAEVRTRDLQRMLLERQATVLQRTAEDMRRYALKHDAVRRYLASQEETTVAAHGLSALAGHRQVNFVPRQINRPGSAPRAIQERETV